MLIDLSDAELKTKLNEAKTYNEIFVMLITLRKKEININNAVAQLIENEKNNRIVSGPMHLMGILG